MRTTLSVVGYKESYKKSADFLGNNVEDWGCGTGWAKRYFKNYKGIDGSLSKGVIEATDLADYTSEVDNILMREVLEYNIEWKKVLDNVKKSFKKKFCLIISTPFAKETHVHEWFRDIPEMQFRKQDILDQFKGYKVKKETIKTDHLYKQDWILYVERI